MSIFHHFHPLFIIQLIFYPSVRYLFLKVKINEFILHFIIVNYYLTFYFNYLTMVLFLLHYSFYLTLFLFRFKYEDFDPLFTFIIINLSLKYGNEMIFGQKSIKNNIIFIINIKN